MIVLAAHPRRDRRTRSRVRNAPARRRLVRGAEQVAVLHLNVQRPQTLHRIGITAGLQLEQMQADEARPTGSRACRAA
jgi:hypothetical protein